MMQPTGFFSREESNLAFGDNVVIGQGTEDSNWGGSLGGGWMLQTPELSSSHLSHPAPTWITGRLVDGVDEYSFWGYVFV